MCYVYTEIGAEAICCAEYGQGTGGLVTVFQNDLQCTGEERNLSQCTQKFRRHRCGHERDAGVICSKKIKKCFV